MCEPNLNNLNLLNNYAWVGLWMQQNSILKTIKNTKHLSWKSYDDIKSFLAGKISYKGHQKQTWLKSQNKVVKNESKAVYRGGKLANGIKLPPHSSAYAWTISIYEVPTKAIKLQHHFYVSATSHQDMSNDVHRRDKYSLKKFYDNLRP
jgi:hypothetical protein